MKRRVFIFDEPAHRTAERLLPWFVNGTLTGEERRAVEQHLGECSRCQCEVEWLRELHAASLHDETALNATPSFQKLRHRLGESPDEWAWALHLRKLWQRTQPWARWTVAAELVVILVLGGLLLSNPQPAAYRALAAVDNAPHPTGSLVVLFDPRISEAELRRIVRGIGARFVDGPTATDAYILELPAERREAALKMLRTERAVTLAEPLGRETAR